MLLHDLTWDFRVKAPLVADTMVEADCPLQSHNLGPADVSSCAVDVLRRTYLDSERDRACCAPYWELPFESVCHQL